MWWGKMAWSGGWGTELGIARAGLGSGCAHRCGLQYLEPVCESGAG